MARQVQLRRGSTTDHNGFTGALGEVTVDTDKKTVVVHDGATAGGIPLARGDRYKAIDGNAANPVYTFEDDPDTGFYRSNTNELAWATGGVQRGYVDANGLAAFNNGIKSVNGIHGGQITIADDAVGSITPPRQGVLVFISYSNDSAFPAHDQVGAAWVDTGDSLFATKMFGSSTFAVLDSDVTGTTGTDGNVSIGRVANAIKIENRVGGSLTFWYNFIG